MCLVSVKLRAPLSCSSTERKEAQSASLSAKEGVFGQTRRRGDQRGRGVAEDTSDNPPTPPSTTTSSSFQRKMPETESEREPPAFPLTPQSVESEPPHPTSTPPRRPVDGLLDFCLMHLALTFFITLYKGRKK